MGEPRLLAVTATLRAPGPDRASDREALVAVAPLGVDIERPSRVAAAPLDAFTPGEVSRVDGDPHALAACWAVKEAVLKRDGRGLRVDPAAVDVDLGLGTARLAGVEQPVTVRWPASDLVLAVAAGGAAVRVEIAGDLDLLSEAVSAPRRPSR